MPKLIIDVFGLACYVNMLNVFWDCILINQISCKIKISSPSWNRKLWQSWAIVHTGGDISQNWVKVSPSATSPAPALTQERACVSNTCRLAPLFPAWSPMAFNATLPLKVPDSNSFFHALGSQCASESGSRLKASLRKVGPSCKSPKAQLCVQADWSSFWSLGLKISECNAKPASFRLHPSLTSNQNALQTVRERSSEWAGNQQVQRMHQPDGHTEVLLCETGWVSPVIGAENQTHRFLQGILPIMSPSFIESWYLKHQHEYFCLSWRHS